VKIITSNTISLLLVCAACATADIIEGTVTDAGDSKPLSGVKVAVDATHFTFTGTDGRYSLNTDVISGVRAGNLPPAMRWDAPAGRFRWDKAYGTVIVEVSDVRGSLLDRRTIAAASSEGGYAFDPSADGIRIVFLNSRLGTFRFKTYKIGNLPLEVRQDYASGEARPAAFGKSAAANNLTFTKMTYAPGAKTATGSQSNVDIALQPDAVATWTNGLVEASYTRAGGAFTAKNLASGVVFIKSAELSQSGGSARFVENVTENNLTGGWAMEISYSDGNRDRIILFPGSQFVYFKKWIGNTTGADRTVKSIDQVKATVTGKTGGASLKAAGTAISVTGPDQKSYHFLALAEPVSRNGVVGAWVTNDIASGIVAGGVAGSDATLTGISEFGTLNIAAGKTRECEMFAIGYFEDALDGLAYNADDIARVYQIKMRPNEVVFCTWLSVGGAGNQDQMASTSSWLNKNLVDYGYTVAQIDDHWQNGDVEFDKGTSGSYSRGMKAVADVIKTNRLKPGIWFMPFAGTSGSGKFSTMYLHDAGGGTESSSWAQTNLDVTHPDTKAYISKIAHQFVDWGYQYYKVDGMFTGLAGHQNYINDTYKTDDFFFGAKLNDKYQTPIEGYRNAWKLIKSIGPDVFIMGCTISQNMRSMQGSFGLLDALRIGPDGSGTWDAIVGRGLIRAGRRYFYNGRVFWVDPDPTYPDLGFGRMICTYNGFTGFLYNAIHSNGKSSFADLSADQVLTLKRTMPFHGSTNLKAIDFWERANPGVWILSDSKSGPRRDVIGLFNWNQGGGFVVNYPLGRFGLDASAQYIGFDYWGDAFVGPFGGSVNQVLAGAAARIISVRKLSGEPMVVSTNRHVADPIYSIEKEAWGGGALSGTSKVVGGDDYELRIYAAKTGGGNWTPGTVTVDGGATASVSANAAQVRVTIKSATNKTINWSIPFN
jgi:hypothetical protein